MTNCPLCDGGEVTHMIEQTGFGRKKNAIRQLELCSTCCDNILSGNITHLVDKSRTAYIYTWDAIPKTWKLDSTLLVDMDYSGE